MQFGFVSSIFVVFASISWLNIVVSFSEKELHKLLVHTKSPTLNFAFIWLSPMLLLYTSVSFDLIDALNGFNLVED